MAETKINLEGWKPKTELGRKVKSGEITNMDEILDNGLKIMETEIVDYLIPGIETDFMLIGQAKGKFGGGQRRLFKQTQKKTAEGNVPSFTTFSVVGNRDGYIGVALAKGKETVPARDKSVRLAKLEIIKIRRGCGSWQCNCKTPHSIPFKVTGKSGSVEITLIPAPKGTGLCVEKECQKIMKLAGIRDVWSITNGRTKCKINLIYAAFKALKQLMEERIMIDDVKNLGIEEGKLPEVVKEKIKTPEELLIEEKAMLEEEQELPELLGDDAIEESGEQTVEEKQDGNKK